MSKVLFIAVSLLLFCLSVFTQQGNIKAKETIIPPDIQTILIEAETLPTELKIDVYLKLISSGKIKSQSTKKKLLEDIFYLSFNVKDKIRRKIIGFEGQVLTIRPTFISNSQKYKLDSLSLQTRIISEMLKIDVVRSFELFNEISPNLRLKPLTCQDVLLYETSEFYELIGKFAGIYFSQEQIKQGQRVLFLSPYIENLHSSSQILPLITMISSISLTDNEMFNLVSIFNKSIRKISGDDRSFSYEMSFGAVSRSIFDFSRNLKFSPELYDDYIKSYKDFLIKNLQGSRCIDNVRFEKSTGKTINSSSASEIKLPVYVYEANIFFYKDLPIEVDEIKPSEIESYTFPSEYFTSAKSSQIFRSFRALQNWEDENQSISEAKEGIQWQEAFTNLLTEIDKWEKSENEDEIDNFHQKCLTYRLLLREAPNLSFKETIVRNYLKLLNNNQIQKDFVSEWFLEFDDLINEIEQIKSQSEEQKLFYIIKNSNNIAVRLYLDIKEMPKTTK